MEQVKTLKPALTSAKQIYIVTGTSGYENKSSWLVAAYPNLGAAQKVAKYLQKLADQVTEAIGSGQDELHELKSVDARAWFDEYILYTVDDITYVSEWTYRWEATNESTNR